MSTSVILATVKAPKTSKIYLLQKQTCHSHLEQKSKKFRKENKALKETFREPLQQSQKLKQDNAKQLTIIEEKNAEIDVCKTKLQSTAKFLKEKEQSCKVLENKLASVSADRLIFQEQNNKLREEIKRLKTEKSKLGENLVLNTGISDSIEIKLEDGFEAMKE